MPEIIRQLLNARLPVDAIMGDYLQGSMADLSAKQNGQFFPGGDPLSEQQLRDAGLRPWAISSLQLDR